MPHTYQRRGGEILVNTVTNGSQIGSNISALNDGGFIVVWTDASLEGADTSVSGVKAQRFDANGTKIGDEFLVNTSVANGQGTAQVATLPSGRYVVTWTDSSGQGGDSSGSGIKGQIFEADGTRIGGEFLINTQTANAQGPSSVTELAGGGFVVSWQDSSLIGGDASGSGIKAQLFDSAGAKVGGEILVNTVTSGGQTSPSIVALASGGFAVAWNGAATAGGGGLLGSIRLQLFDASGAKVGSELIANSNDGGALINAKVTAISSGLVVTWAQSESAGGGGAFDVKAQLFDSSGAKVGSDFIVHTSTEGNQMSPDVDSLPGGGFLISWQGVALGLPGTKVYGQIFDAAGAKVGVEFILSSVTDGSQSSPKVDVLPSGDFAVTWTDTSGMGGDASATAIKAQILTLSTAPPTDIILSSMSVSETAREDAPLISLHTIGALNSNYVYTILSDSTGGAFAIEGNRLVVHDNSLLDFELNAHATILLRATDDNGNSYEESVQLDIVDTPESGYAPVTDEFLVHTTVADNQSEPVITALEGGGYLVLWREWPLAGNGSSVGKGRLFDADGRPVTGELALDGEAAAARPGGGFILASAESDGSGFGVAAHIYDSTGAQVGSTIHVNTTTASDQNVESIAILSSGGFVVTWTDLSGGFQQGDVKARIFGADGTPIGGEFVVPTQTTGEQEQSDVTALASGGFVVTWWDGTIKAQIYSASGVRVGPPITVASDNSIEGHVVALADGGFVVTWEKNLSSGGFTAVADFSAQVFDASGNRVGDAILIDPGLSRVHSTDISALPWGGFVVTWAGYDDSATNDPGIRAQVYDGTGTKVGGEFFVSDPAVNEQFAPDVAVLASGDFVVGWTDSTAANGFDTKTRIYAPVVGPTEGSDVLVGTSGDDTLTGLGGTDHLYGREGDDLLIGGLGADVLNGGPGIDTASYEDNWGAVFVNLTLGQGFGNAAQGDTYSGIENVVGSVFNDTLIGSDAVNRLDGGDGNDTLIGSLGGDVLVGGAGIDTASYEDNQGAVFVDLLRGHGYGNAAQGDTYSGIENLRGSVFNDYFIGSDGVNRIEGGDGDDTLLGALGADELIGGNGSDTASYEDNQGAVICNLTAGRGYGNAAEGDTYSGIENLTGTVFNDTFFGDAGDNVLAGKRGNDILVGGGGHDTFVFDTPFEGAINVDTIVDFEAGIDRIALDRAIFTGLGAGSLPASAFVVGAAAQDADDRIIYNSATGELSFDADGNGAGAAIVFAILTNHPTISAGDLLVV